jgi:membrane-bound metal-dependent hydrolase YbcI (DUF457 family)
MFVGHGLLAFALVALGARRLGWTRGATLRVAVVAALFATLPDVDAVYGLVGLAGLPAGGGLAESFWDAGNQVHRGATHSLVVEAVVALAVWLLARFDARSRRAGAATLAGLVAFVALFSGPTAGAVVALFGLVAVALTAGAVALGLSPRAAGLAALAGLLSHPFGDVLTGSPPALLYPFDTTLVAERVVLSADPTLHLLGAFAVELATVWLAALVLFSFSDRSLWTHVDRRAVLGVGYAGAALAIPAPTLDVSYQFVFSVLAVGAVSATPRALPIGYGGRWRALATGLAAVTLAALAYAGVYLAV